jgi:hypothetical protein
MTRVATAYGFFSFLLIINSGAVLSVNRYVLWYGWTASLALGVLLSRHPRWGIRDDGIVWYDAGGALPFVFAWVALGGVSKSYRICLHGNSIFLTQRTQRNAEVFENFDVN